MNMIFSRESEVLKESILRLAGEVEMRLSEVLKATERRDKEALLTWMERDAEIDEREVQIEEECLKILALHQPVARDLRFVVAVLKINNDLERIGDIVVNIAERGSRLTAFPVTDLQERLMQMGRVAREMLKESLDALISLDVHKAIAVIARDDEVDRLNVDVIESVIARATPANTGAMTESLILTHSIARDLERIGDHATNIAEDVAYLVDGTIIRHKSGPLK
ncbi:MAG TPA: phosphate signaling complex protein PhoU [Kiritimatiellia bacterium]|nr:phosphate signaling complex protein PhoU [Kiritimatiellia bacterium]HPS06166.1 phosphate signaling complex protein PhoU [Kiritimatiellia bacterium]